MKKELAAKGIVALGNASDADSRLLAAMKSMSELGTPTDVPEGWLEFFACSMNPPQINFQDFKHHVSRTRNKMLESHIPMKWGEHSVSIEHVRVS